MPKVQTQPADLIRSNGKHFQGKPSLATVQAAGAQPILVRATLADSESWLRAFLEALDDGFAIFSAVRDGHGEITDFRYEYINEAGSLLNQRKREDHLGRTMLELLPAHKEQGLLEAYARVVESGEAFVQQNLEYEDVYGGGKKLARAFDVRVVKLGDGIVAQWRDVTATAKQVKTETEQRLLAETLQEISTILNGTLQRDQVLDHILTQVRRVVPYDTANLMLVEAGVASVARCQGYLERGLSEPSTAHCLEVARTGNLAWMAETGQPKAIPDTWESAEWVKLPGSDWIRSCAGAPLKVKGKTIGFLNVNSATPGQYTPELAKRLLAFAMQAALAIENARLFEEVQRFARRTSLLHDITHAAVSAPGNQVLLQRMADRLGELLRADGACILLWDEAGERMVQSGVSGHLSQVDLSQDSHASRIIVRLRMQNEPVIVEDVDQHDGLHMPSLCLTLAEGESHTGKAFLGLPVLADDRQLGLAIVSFLQPHPFSPEEISAAGQAVDQIALGIAKAQLWERERQQTAQLARANSLILALGHVAAQIETTSEPQDVMSTVGAELRKLGMDCLIALIAEDTQQLALRYVSLPSKLLAKAEKIAGTKKEAFPISPELFPFLQQEIAGKQPVFAAGLFEKVKAALPALPAPLLGRLVKVVGLSEKTKSLFLPLIAKEKVIGTFWLWGDHLQETDLQAASIFASQVAISLENARLYQEIQQLSVTDELTRLYNRRGAIELGQREFSRAVRYSHPLSALMIDIDHFKQINDSLGHPAGDQVLRALAGRCRQHIRREDILSRFGGEEFLVLLPELDLKNALGVAERLRRQVTCQPVAVGQAEVHIAISIGVAARCKGMKNLMDLISRADENLYAAKQAGRDRVKAE